MNEAIKKIGDKISKCQMLSKDICNDISVKIYGEIKIYINTRQAIISRGIAERIRSEVRDE